MRSSPHRHRACRATPHPSAGPSPSADPADLAPEVLLDLLELPLHDPGAPDDGMLLHVADPADGSGQVELGFLPLSGTHPCDLLAGTAAPGHWLAVGVRARGRATRLDSPDQPPGAAHMEVAVTSTGRLAGRLHHGDGAVHDTSRPEGLVVDACLRVFGLPTPPPEAGTAQLWTALWVDRIASTFHDPQQRHRLRCWEAVESLHPAAGDGPDPTAPLEIRAQAHARRWSWEQLRTAPDPPRLPWPPPGPEVRSWHDEGSLARWLLSSMPPIPDVVDDIAPLLGADIERRLRAAVDTCTG